jgi:hypothetical protein
MLTYQLLTGRFPFWEDVRSQTLTDVWKAIMTQGINWNAPVSVITFSLHESAAAWYSTTRGQQAACKRRMQL